MTADRRAQLALWLLVLSTVALLPGGMNRWVLAKLVVAGIGVLLAFTVPAAGRVPRRIAVAIGATLAVLLVAALLGVAPASALLGRWPRYEGAVALTAYLGAFAAGARLLGPTAPSLRRSGRETDAAPPPSEARERRIRSLQHAAATAAVLLGVVSLLEGAGFRPLPTDLERPGALLGNATDQGLVGLLLAATLALPAIRAIGARATDAWLLAAGLALAAATVVISASRAALLGTALIAVLLLVRAVITNRRTALPIAGGLAALIGAALALPFTRDRLLGESPLSGQVVDDRLASWAETVALVGAHPLLGVGPNGFLDAIPARHGTGWFAAAGLGTTIDSPHDVFLQAAAAGGLLGLGGLLVIAALIGARAVQAIRAAATDTAAGGVTLVETLTAAAIAAAGYTLAITTHFTSAGPTVLAALLLGLLVSEAVPTTSTPEKAQGRARSAPAVRVEPAGDPAWRRVAVPTLLGLWLVTTSLALVAEWPLQAGVDAGARGDLAGADGAFETAAALRPWDADVPLIAAQVFAQAADAGAPGAADLAIARADAALARVPASVLAAKAKAVAQTAAGDVDGAIDTLEELRAHAVNDPEVEQRLGGLLLVSGDVEAAARHLERATELAPEEASLWQTLGYFYEQTGDTGGAASVTRRLMELGAVE